MTAAAGTRVAADRSLLKYKNYEEYLDSLVTRLDMHYLRSLGFARQVAELGYRSTGETLSRKSFGERVRAVKDLLYPIYRVYVLDSEVTPARDPLEHALALRERANRLGALSTVIYLRVATSFNNEISGYIDYAERLSTEDWRSFFRSRRKIRPRKSDLAYYNWRSGKTVLNGTSNYRPTIDEKLGLLFKNLHDGKYIVVDPCRGNTPGAETTRVRVRSNRYEHVVLYDHAVR